MLSPTPLKIYMSLAVGMTKLPTEWKNIKMFQPTNQSWYLRDYDKTWLLKHDLQKTETTHCQCVLGN